MSQELLDQLREKYKRAAEKYGDKIFNIKDLESRITHLLQTRGSLDTFLKAEMEFYEKASNIAKTKEEEIKRKKESNARIEAILEKNLEKIKKYRDSFFDPSVSIEVRKMVGAISDWYKGSFPLIKYLFRGAEIWSELSVLEAELERINMQQGRPITPFLKHYVDDLKKMGSSEKESVERRLIQTCANTLYKTEDLLKKELNKMKDFQKTRVVTMSPAFDPDTRNKWEKYKESEAIIEVINGISVVIDDFRLRDLAALGFKTEENNKQ
ncbi:MAG: hypothetical protein OEV78_03110 [Spirochaetia bacterium]|nr:hypothetical protein [Spirochaetia bacterium]